MDNQADYESSRYLINSCSDSWVVATLVLKSDLLQSWSILLEHCDRSSHLTPYVKHKENEQGGADESHNTNLELNRGHIQNIR